MFAIAIDFLEVWKAASSRNLVCIRDEDRLTQAAGAAAPPVRQGLRCGHCRRSQYGVSKTP